MPILPYVFYQLFGSPHKIIQESNRFMEICREPVMAAVLSNHFPTHRYTQSCRQGLKDLKLDRFSESRFPATVDEIRHYMYRELIKFFDQAPRTYYNNVLKKTASTVPIEVAPPELIQCLDNNYHSCIEAIEAFCIATESPDFNLPVDIESHLSEYASFVSLLFRLETVFTRFDIAAVRQLVFDHKPEIIEAISQLTVGTIYQQDQEYFPDHLSRWYISKISIQNATAEEQVQSVSVPVLGLERLSSISEVYGAKSGFWVEYFSSQSLDDVIRSIAKLVKKRHETWIFQRALVLANFSELGVFQNILQHLLSAQPHGTTKPDTLDEWLHLLNDPLSSVALRDVIVIPQRLTTEDEIEDVIQRAVDIIRTSLRDRVESR